MATRDFAPRSRNEQTPSEIVDRAVRPEAFTTRDRVANGVAAGWLEMHPEINVTEADLAKTLQQLLTEVFQTGKQRGREQLSTHAVSLLDMVGSDTTSFAAARTFSKTADMPVDYGVKFAGLAEVLAPLAAAIQLARIPVADAAVRVRAADGSEHSIARSVLRGYVVCQVSTHAQAIHARVGVGESAAGYLQLILRDTDLLAAKVVAAASTKRARPAALSTVGAQRLNDFAKGHLSRLSKAAGRYGLHGDDAVGDTMVKLAAAYRTNPQLSIDYPYARQALTHAAHDLYAGAAKRRAHETTDTEEAERWGGSYDDTVTVDVADLVVRKVLTAAQSLADSDAATERALARQTLLQYFLDDPAVVDPRQARLGSHVLELSVPGHRDKDDEVAAGLGTIAARLTSNRAAARRICTLAIAALRHPNRCGDS
ncbi:RNA polymerase subunit sigma-24 [Mycobacterium sp. TJFP1]